MTVVAAWELDTQASAAWEDEFAALSRPGQRAILLALLLDYQNNVASYPKWQQWLKDNQPPILAMLETRT